MILDRLSKLTIYKGISSGLDTAIEYLRNNDVGVLPDGKYPIDGKNVIANVMSYSTKEFSEAVYEAHRDYIDIQILLSGEELCYWTPLQGLTPRNAFDEGNDIGFYDGQGGVSFPLTPDTFAIFFPHDAHKPSCNLARKCEVRKVVIKIAI